MLFSEPKIPQSKSGNASLKPYCSFQCSSASRKFLNTIRRHQAVQYQTRFQCSSASRKFLNQLETALRQHVDSGFQCSSASRKFLNLAACRGIACAQQFQCSSASRKFLNDQRVDSHTLNGIVSVLFSEPKIPQYGVIATVQLTELKFQCSSASRKFLNHALRRCDSLRTRRFSALQRAENSSMR